MDDEIARERCRGRLRMIPVVRVERFGDLVQPFLELARGPGVERREAADDEIELSLRRIRKETLRLSARSSAKASRQ